MYKKISYCRADNHTSFSGTACCMLIIAIPDVKNFGSTFIRSMVLTYLPDGTNVNGSRGLEFEGQGQCRGLKIVKSCSSVAIPIHFFRCVVLGAIVE